MPIARYNFKERNARRDDACRDIGALSRSRNVRKSRQTEIDERTDGRAEDGAESAGCMKAEGDSSRSVLNSEWTSAFLTARHLVGRSIRTASVTGTCVVPALARALSPIGAVVLAV